MKNFLFIILFVFCLPTIAFGESKESVSSNYIVKPVFNDYQNTKDNGKFNMSLEQNKKYQLFFELRNDSDEPVTLTTRKLDSITGSSGTIDFVEDANDNLINEGFKVAPMLNIDTKIYLQAHEVKLVQFELKTSKKMEEGTYLGAIAFKEESKHEKTKAVEGKQNSSIQTDFEIEKVLPIQFKIGTLKTDNEQSPEIIKVEQNNGYLELDIKNKNAVLLDNAKMNIKVNKKDKSNSLAIFENTIDLQMSPLSKTTIKIPWNGEVKSGNYNAEFELILNDKKTVKTVPFSIEDKTIKKMKEKSVENNQVKIVEENTTLIYSLIGILLILSFLFILIFLKQKKKMKELSNKIEPK